MTVSPVFTVDSCPPLLVLLSTEVSTLVSVSRFALSRAFAAFSPPWRFRNKSLTLLLNRADDSLKPVVLVGPLEGNFLASFGLGWAVTTGSGLASYPLDTIRRRMMMTSGAKVHYKGMMDAGSQIIAKEGVKSLFKG